MILIGQYDSPFVRRVGIALRQYGIAYEHRPWSVWGDADQLGRINPLRRVPTVILDDGTTLIDSWAILDALDDQVGPDLALLPRTGLFRRDGLRICALATGLADKSVSLFYEGLLRNSPSSTWIDRCRQQIADTLDALETDRARRQTPFWLGSRLSHADIAVACALRFTREAHPGLFDPLRWSRLAAHAQICESLDDFRAISQPLTVAGREESPPLSP